MSEVPGSVDDVVALTLFGFLATVATWSVAGERTGLARDSIWEIVGAVLIGLVLGLPAAALTERLRPGTPTREEFLAKYADNIIEQNRIVGLYENH